MCAIIDANVLGDVFGPKPTQAGKEFFDWITDPKGSGRLICGGELQKELMGSSKGFREWARVALNTGRMRNINEGEVEREMAQIRKSSILSNDPHILALAQVSGARLLYSNDKTLHKDFKNPALIDPAGSIYSKLMKKKDRQKLLDKKGLCPSAKSMEQP